MAKQSIGEINWYPWLNTPYRQLVTQYQVGRGHHALLVHTLPGNGGDALIWALSRWLMCQHPQGEKSCGQCHSCCLMLARTHPDWHLLEPEKNKNSVGIEAVRQLIEKLHAYAQQGGRKVIWLPHTELLTDAAAHALLKTLEEPPEKTYFLLSCHEPSSLLATLRSRCFYWHLTSPNTALSLPWLDRHATGNAVDRLTALKLNGGAPLVAKQLLQPERWSKRLALCTALGDALLQRDMLSLLPQLDHNDVGDRLYWLSSLLLDALKGRQGAREYIVNQDQYALVQQLAQRLSTSSLLQAVNGWSVCRYQLLSVIGVNRELLLTEQLLSWEHSLTLADSLHSHSL